MPWAAFVWLAQMKNVESGVCQLLCSAEKSPLLLFLCVAKVCTLDKSPVSDRGTRCCSRERERTDRLCSCSPPSPPPSQGASRLFGITCCTSRQRPPTPPLWAVKRHRTPRWAAHVPQPRSPPRCPADRDGGRWRARGRGTWAQPGAATQLRRRLCLHVQINIHEAEPKGQSQLSAAPVTALPVARTLREQPPAWHGTEQMVRAAWPAAAASPRLLASHHLTEATWASRGPGTTPRHRGQSRSSCRRGGAGTERAPKSPRPSQHHHLPGRILLQAEQQTGVAVGRIWQAKTPSSKVGWQRDRSTSGKSSKAAVTQ